MLCQLKFFITDTVQVICGFVPKPRSGCTVYCVPPPPTAFILSALHDPEHYLSPGAQQAMTTFYADLTILDYHHFTVVRAEAAVRRTYLPVMKFSFEEIMVDLTFARLNLPVHRQDKELLVSVCYSFRG